MGIKDGGMGRDITPTEKKNETEKCKTILSGDKCTLCQGLFSFDSFLQRLKTFIIQYYFTLY